MAMVVLESRLGLYDLPVTPGHSSFDEKTCRILKRFLVSDKNDAERLLDGVGFVSNSRRVGSTDRTSRCGRRGGATMAANVGSSMSGPTRRTQAERRAAMRTRLLDATLNCLVSYG